MSSEGQEKLWAAIHAQDTEGMREALKRTDAQAGAARDGQTPLFAAISRGDLAIAKLLVEAGANVNFRVKNTDFSETALHWAMRIEDDGMLPIVEYLLSQGANVEALNKNGLTPLFVATIHGMTDRVVALLKNGAKVDALNENGISPLFCAAEHGHADILELLVAAGADPKHEFPEDGTVLNVAAKAGNLSCVEYLLKCEVDVDSLDADRNTPLLNATRANNLQICQALLEAGANPQAYDDDGYTALMGLMIHGVEPEDSLAPLLAFDMGLELRGNSGETALMLAATHGRANHFLDLLNAGASLDARNENDLTAIDIAKDYDRQEILAALEYWQLSAGIKARQAAAPRRSRL